MVEAIRQGDIPGVQLRRRQPLEVPAEIAWRWLSEPDLLELWLAPRIEGDFRKGGRVQLSSENGEGSPLEESGKVVEFQPPERCVLYFEQANLKWTAATKLSFELLPEESCCELSIFHEGFEYLSLSECLTFWEFYRCRWRDALTRLAAAVRA